MKRLPCFSLLVLICSFLIMNTALANVVWKEIAVDGNYGKLYQPSSVKVVSATNGVATLIRATIKTTYNLEAAQETIAGYEIGNIIADPSKLAYSVADVEINPQNRTIRYAKEDFYDTTDKVIWSAEPREPKEVHKERIFEEDYYATIVDAVFHQGERERCKAGDRWRTLWQETEKDGSTAVSMADTSTMRQRGENTLIFWEWIEKKTLAGQTTEVQFLKKAVRLNDGTQKIIEGKKWTPQTPKWVTVASSGVYEKIPTKGAKAGGLQFLRAYHKGYQYWLNRYRTDKIVKLPAKNK